MLKDIEEDKSERIKTILIMLEGMTRNGITGAMFPGFKAYHKL